jgi:hypothetical protein
LAATWNRNERELLAARAEFANNEQWIGALLAEARVLPHSGAGSLRRFEISRALMRLRARQIQLPKTNERLTGSREKLQTAIQSARALGAFMEQRRGSMEYRIYVETDGGDVDLVATTGRSSPSMGLSSSP